jgi:hypothetical protein
MVVVEFIEITVTTSVVSTGSTTLCAVIEFIEITAT